MSRLHTLRAQFAHALAAFGKSPSSTFQVLHTVPPSSRPAAVQTLYVLDSSFNPPSRAHLQMAVSALSQAPAAPSRLLLLLATHNADKAPRPAAFEDRLVMMALLAEDVRNVLSLASPSSSFTAAAAEDPALPAVDIGVTTHPYFVDKARDIGRAPWYRDAGGTNPAPPTQVHLVGYDTLVRILDPRYYPPTHSLAVLDGFLGGGAHRLRVTARTDDAWGDRAAQEEFVRGIGEGALEAHGGRREWASQIELVDGHRDDEPVVSSTLARDAAKRGSPGDLARYVTERVGRWIEEERLYRDE